MAKYNNLIDFLTSIANTFRPILGTNDKINPQDFESYITRVYDIAENRGYSFGFDDSKKVEYDVFWDNFQGFGDRLNYQSAFSGDPTKGGWNDYIFQPKYNIVAGNSLYDLDYIFQYARILDIKGCLSRNGVILDSSLSQRLYCTFDRSFVQYAPILDCSNCGSMYQVFNLTTYLKSCGFTNIQPNCTFNNVFVGCSALIDVSITGTIGNNGLNFSESPNLSKESIINIINVLSNTTTGLSITLSAIAKQNAFTDSEWASLIAKKPNWTISLV